jgi:hypothetical protein
MGKGMKKIKEERYQLEQITITKVISQVKKF